MTGFKDRIASGDRVVTVRDRDGTALFELDARYAAAITVLVVARFPRVAAIAALGALTRGVSITVDAAEAPAEHQA